MQRMIVTGAAGFIGSNFVRRALEDTQAEVLVFDALTYAGSLASLEDVADHPRYSFVRGDITDREAVRDTFADFKPDTVVNFAAESHVDRSIDGPGAFVQTNIVGTFELLEAARGHVAELEADARAAFRFLHVSTDEVYGSLGPEGLFLETTPYAPNSPYAASKAGADHLVRAYVHTYGLPAVITNCSNNYGPYQFPEKLIPLMILNAAEGRDLPIYGDGSNVRDWLYVDDHCVGILRALEVGVPGEKYNLGGDSERTNLQVVEAICDLLEAERPAAENEALRARGAASYRDLVTFVTDRPGHDQRYAIDASKAKAALDWRPAHDFESGLAATVRWYLDHDAWCRAVSSDRYDRSRLGLGDAAGGGEEE
ncbi:MAG: dTDP-glucose 4,6-dehydratase [Acidobacteriota bacterium]